MKKKRDYNHLLANIFVFLLACFITTVPAFSESGIYDRIGIITEHGLHGAVPEENIDLFTGNLTLTNLDIQLPGPNGFDLKIWRVYNSKIVKDRLAGGAWAIQQDPYSWVGLGWSMHMGRVHSYESDTPVIEFPDGRWETAYPSTGGTYHVTRGFLKYDKNAYKLYFKDGTVWTFGEYATVYPGGGMGVQVRVVTRIENSFGHHIDIEYETGSSANLKKITDSMGRVVTFSTNNNRLTRISLKNALGQTVNYDYLVDTFSNGYYRLSQFTPPEIDPVTYDYENGQGDNWKLTGVHTSYGGCMQYTYEDHTFNYNVYSLDTRVVTSKKIDFGTSGNCSDFKTWTYTYPDYNNVSEGTVTVTGPEFDTEVTYFAYDANNQWKIGLLKEKRFTDNSFSQVNEWQAHEISNDKWSVLKIPMGTIKASLLLRSTVTRAGDATGVEEYLYERPTTLKYGLPTRIKYYGGTTGTQLFSQKTLEYFFENNSNFEDKYMVSHVFKESIYDSSGNTKLKETETTYSTNTADGTFSSIDKVKKLKEGSTYLTWDYSYSSNANGSAITVTIDLPGKSNGNIETHKYSWGVQSELHRPGYTEYTRSISPHNSAILSETNRFGGVMAFAYDDLDRIILVDMPGDFNDIEAIWDNNSVLIKQGFSRLEKTWDGLGRDLGYSEIDKLANPTPEYFFKKKLDAKGRVTEESKGGTSDTYVYKYEYNDAGNPTKITTPLGHSTITTYTGNQKTVKDPRQNTTAFTYTGFPGAHTGLTDAEGLSATLTYDVAGRLSSINYSGRNHGYIYNGLDQVKSENHPETGTISYIYDTEGNLYQETWGGITHTYTYNNSNQLTQLNTGDETIDYTYDNTTGALTGVSGSGWSRTGFTYNVLGSIKSETQSVGGAPSSWTTSYDYDGNNNLKEVVYPSGRKQTMTNNGHGLPQTTKFNGATIADGLIYSMNKEPYYMKLGNNTTVFQWHTKLGELTEYILAEGHQTYAYRPLASTIMYYYEQFFDANRNLNYFSTGTIEGKGFIYDKLNRLTDIEIAGKTYEYSYDNSGNMLTAKVDNVPVLNAGYNYSNRNLSYTYDSRGNVTDIAGYHYQWDKKDRLTSISVNGGTTVSTHLYNERDLRLRASREVPPSISAVSPGSSLLAGTTTTITWTSTGIVGDVTIQYSSDNGVNWTEITSSTENNGAYNWTVPATVSGTCLVKVSETDGNPSAVSSIFSIVPAPTITIIEPNGGEEWRVGEVLPIFWQSTGMTGRSVKIEYYHVNQGNAAWTYLATDQDNVYYWDSPTVASDQYKIRITDYEGLASDESDDFFTVIEPPTLTITSPNGGETLTAGTTHTITWTSERLPVFAPVDIFYSLDNGNSWNNAAISPLSAHNTGSVLWTVPFAGSNQCLLRIMESYNGYFWDNFTEDSSDAVFTIVEPPDIAVISPNGGETLVAGTSRTIRWTAPAGIATVQIEYSKDNGSSWTDIVSSTQNDGFFDWSIPYGDSSNCLIRVSDTGGGQSDVSDAVFSIGGPPVTCGNTWESGSVSASLKAIAYGNSMFVAVGFPNDILTSTDGVHWTPQDPGTTSNVDEVIFANSQFVIVCSDGNTLTSTDGVNWTEQSPGSPSSFNQMHFADSKIVGVGSGGEIRTSTDAIYWSPKTSGTTESLLGVTYGNTLWVAVGANGTILTSPDTTTWTAQTSPTGNHLYTVAYGNSTFVAAGLYGEIFTSSDGITWNTQTSGTPKTLFDMVFAENQFTAVGDWGTVLNSPDGITWTPASTGITETLEGIAYGNSMYVAVANDKFVTSYCGNVPASITLIAPNGGEYLETGSSVPITWATTGTVGNVKIEFSTDNGLNYSTVIDSTGNNGSYDWIVPNTASSECLVKISTLDDSLTDTSDLVFSIVAPAAIAVTSPNGGEELKTGYSHTITWTGTGTVSDVSIEYSPDSGVNWTEIVSSTPNTGSYDWAVPYDEAENCLIRVTGTGGYPTDSSDAEFSIVFEPGLTVTSPNGGEVLVVGETAVVLWSTYGSIYQVDISYSTDNGANWTLIKSGEPNEGSCSWIVPFELSNECLIRINETGDPTRTDDSDAVFSIVRPDAIKVLSPNGGETWQAGSSQTIAWITPGTVQNVAIDYSFDNGQTWTEITNSTPDDSNFDWTVPDTGSASCLVRVSGADLDTEPADTSDAVFSILSDTPVCVKTWSDSGYSGTDNFNAAAYGNGQFVAVGAGGAVFTSPGGSSWTQQTSGFSNSLNGIVFSSALNLFVAVGDNGGIITSSDGIAWTSQISNNANDLNAVAFSGGQFVVVGGGGTILTSSDGIAWTAQVSGVNQTLYGITYGNGVFVAVGGGGTILTSNSSTSWNKQSTTVTSNLYAVAFGNNNFVAAGDNDEILTGTNGQDWQIRWSVFNTPKRAIAYGAGVFVMVGDSGEIYTGSDFSSCIQQNSGTGSHLTGIVYDNNRFVVTGEQTILYSVCGPEIPTITVTSPASGDEWSVGNFHDITWTCTGSVGNVDIEYSTDNGVNWTVIAAATVNNGTYNWQIPDTPSAACLVRVSETDGSPSAVSTGTFSIISTAEPSLTVLTPNGGESLAAGSTYDITWATTGNVAVVAIDYSTDNGSSWRHVTAAADNIAPYTFAWTVPDTASQGCLVRISGTGGDPNPEDTGDAVFTITSDTGSITVTSPNGKETLTAGDIHTVTWTTSGIVGDVKIEYSTDSGDSWTTAAEIEANDGSYDWTVPAVESDHCLLRISEAEESTVMDTSNAEFSITSPTGNLLVLTVPNGGENWTAGNTYPITWTSMGSVTDVSLEYSTDSGANWTVITASTPNTGSYDWTVPAQFSQNCLVRVSETGGASDTSNAVFAINEQPTLTVTAPNGGETFEAGTAYAVTWTSTGAIDDVAISYSIDNGGTWTFVTQTTVNDGSFTWLVPDTPSVQCVIQVSQTGSDSGASDVSDAVFSISSPTSPVLNITYPNGGETLTVGMTYEIAWSAAGTAVDNIKLDVSTDGGVNWTEITATTTNTGTYSWTVPDTPSLNCLVRVSDIDDDPTDTSDAVFTIESAQADSITVTSPNGGEALTAGDVHDITWTSTGTISSVLIESSTDNGESWAAITEPVTNSGTFSWTVPDTASESCLMRISKNDEDGEPSDISDAVFSIVDPVGTITVTSPNGYERLIQGDLHTITWTSTGSITNVDISYSIDNGGAWEPVTDSTENNGSFDWTVPDTPSDLCLLKIAASDSDTAISDTSDDTFLILDSAGTCGELWGSGYTSANALRSIAYGNEKWVAVGDGGSLITGAIDLEGALVWTPRSPGITGNLLGIAYGNNLFVAVGADGTIVTSPGGSSWTMQTSSITTSLNDVVFGNNTFTAVGDSGVALTSSDGMEWTEQTTGTTTDIQGITYGSNKFAAVGTGGTIITSPDGVTWTNQNSGAAGTLYGIAYGGGEFIATGANGLLLTSPNGSSWTKRTSTITADFMDAAYSSDHLFFVIVGKNGKILTGSSADGWTVQTSGTRSNLNGIVYQDPYFMAVGDSEILLSQCPADTGSSNEAADTITGTGSANLPPTPGHDNEDNKHKLRLPLRILSPNGGETLVPGEPFLVKWEGAKQTTLVRLDYSPDNGTTYFPIATNVANTGFYEWTVPHHISRHCTLRVGPAYEGDKTNHHLRYSVRFITETIETGETGTFTLWLGDAGEKHLNPDIPAIAFSRESNGNLYMLFQGEARELTGSNDFSLRSHELKAEMDTQNRAVTILLDSVPIFENVPVSPGYRFSPAVSFSIEGESMGVFIHKVAVDILSQETTAHDREQNPETVKLNKSFHGGSRGAAFSKGAPLAAGGKKWINLFNETFDTFFQGSLPMDSGWAVSGIEPGQEGTARIDRLHAYAEKSLRLQTGSANETVIKRFSLPTGFPFDTNDNRFEIRYNTGMEMQTNSHLHSDPYGEVERVEPYRRSHGPDTSGPVSGLSSGTTGLSTTQALTNTYYIYSVDGKLLAEYDHGGICRREYIYLNGKVLAEYKGGRYYYYTTDHINSTRVIADDSGNILYKAYYGPYGEEMTTADDVKLIDPKMKFSGKEREAYSDLDYFGARYYDNHSYRFISVDPVMNREESLSNPQLLNLYAYCRNNPMTFLDPDGLDTILGIHSNVKPSASFSSGHVWISIYDTDINVTQTRGLWPNSHPLTQSNRNQQSDVRENLEIPDYIGKYSRYYHLTAEQELKLQKIITKPDKWSYWRTCADWASDVVMYVTGEDVDADDYFGFETPREVSSSIKKLEKKNPTSLVNPHKGRENRDSSSRK